MRINKSSLSATFDDVDLSIILSCLERCLDGTQDIDEQLGIRALIRKFSFLDHLVFTSDYEKLFCVNKED